MSDRSDLRKKKAPAALRAAFGYSSLTDKKRFIRRGLRLSRSLRDPWFPLPWWKLRLLRLRHPGSELARWGDVVYQIRACAHDWRLADDGLVVRRWYCTRCRKFEELAKPRRWMDG